MEGIIKAFRFIVELIRLPLPSTKTCVVWDFPIHNVISWELAYKQRNSMSKRVITDLRIKGL